MGKKIIVSNNREFTQKKPTKSSSVVKEELLDDHVQNHGWRGGAHFSL
jgi:hypothetical protein